MAADHDYETVFRIFDRDGSGSVDRSELEAMLRALGAQGPDAERLMAERDLDRNGKLTFSEFASVCKELFSSDS
ncbi:EF-hand domain-containing protein [Nocardia transvalensis]|uniref:EF-hand domain-containing protein n=1 Tax=Nocardia transvalensis TaxID=37333 RepID=UPI0018948940|nr:EF-hand domain-containing protein [Nocardia transvalensis]MBF6330514.1 EF-hand domain-containing protein [Nocardia transvalensis]